MAGAIRISIEELSDHMAALLACLFVARGLDARGLADPAVLRERLAELDRDAGPGPRNVDHWRRLQVAALEFRLPLGVADVREQHLDWQLEQLAELVDQRIRHGESLPRWRPLRLASPAWDTRRRELDQDIVSRLEAVLVDVAELTRRIEAA